MTDITPPNQPLHGIRVVEIGTSVAAPYAAWILGTLGAEIIKVERPDTGDDARQWGRLFADGRSSFFLAMNQNKHGITIDFKNSQQRQWLREYCISHADVVIQNMRPGRIEESGLGALELVSANQRLVYCNLGAFGRVGPLKDNAGYDPLMQAYGGLMSITGEEGRPPVRVGVSIIDMGTGMWSAIGIISALFRRAGTGQGCVVDASLFETALAWTTNQSTTVQVDHRDLERLGSGARGMAPYQAYHCSDGYLVVAAPNDRLFHRLCAALNYLQWKDEPRFSTNQLRFQHLVELNEKLEPVFNTESRSYWQKKLNAAGIPCAPVQTLLETMADQQTQALGILQQTDSTQPKMMGLPLSFDGERPKLRSMAPELGEHNHQIKGDDV